MKKYILFGLFVVIFNSVLIVGMEKEKKPEQIKDLIYDVGGKTKTRHINLETECTLTNNNFQRLIQNHIKSTGLSYILCAVKLKKDSKNKKKKYQWIYFDASEFNRHVFNKDYSIKNETIDNKKIINFYYFEIQQRYKNFYRQLCHDFRFLCDKKILERKDKYGNFFRTYLNSNFGNINKIHSLIELYKDLIELNSNANLAKDAKHAFRSKENYLSIAKNLESKVTKNQLPSHKVQKGSHNNNSQLKKRRRRKEKQKNTKKKKILRTLIYPKIEGSEEGSVSNNSKINLLEKPFFAKNELTFEDLIKLKKDMGLYFILASVLCKESTGLVRRYFDSEDFNRKVFDENYNNGKIITIDYFKYNVQNGIFDPVCGDLSKQNEEDYNFYRTLFKANTGKKKSILKLADLLYNERNYREAIKYYSVLTKMDDSDQYAFYRLGLSFCNRKMYRKAVKHLESAKRLGHIASNKILGCIYSEIEDLKDDGLASLYKDCANFFEKNHNLLYKTGLDLLNNKKQKQEAISKFIEAANGGHFNSIKKLITIYSEDDGSDQVKYYKKQIKIYEKQNSQTEICINKIKKENCSRKKRNKRK